MPLVSKSGKPYRNSLILVLVASNIYFKYLLDNVDIRVGTDGSNFLLDLQNWHFTLVTCLREFLFSSMIDSTKNNLWDIPISTILIRLLFLDWVIYTIFTTAYHFQDNVTFLLANPYCIPIRLHELVRPKGPKYKGLNFFSTVYRYFYSWVSTCIKFELSPFPNFHMSWK